MRLVAQPLQVVENRALRLQHERGLARNEEALQAGVAVGKYIGHRLYAEVITDGRQYSATNLEYRITRWLSLLASVSTVGRNGVNARVSHDY